MATLKLACYDINRYIRVAVVAGSAIRRRWVLTKPKTEVAAPVERKGLSPRAFAVAMDMSESGVLRGIKRGEIRAVRIGNRYVIPTTEFDRLFSGAVSQPGAAA